MVMNIMNITDIPISRRGNPRTFKILVLFRKYIIPDY